MRERKHWGWGFADEQPSQDELRAAAAGIAEVFGFGSRDVEAPVQLEQAALREPRIAPPPRLVRMARAGLLGRKTGRGFFAYDG